MLMKHVFVKFELNGCFWNGYFWNNVPVKVCFLNFMCSHFCFLYFKQSRADQQTTFVRVWYTKIHFPRPPGLPYRLIQNKTFGEKIRPVLEKFIFISYIRKCEKLIL